MPPKSKRGCKKCVCTPMNNTAKATLCETGLGPVSKSKQPDFFVSFVHFFH